MGSFWVQVLMMITLIVLCWGSGYGVYCSNRERPLIPGVLGILGFILLVVLVIIFYNGDTQPVRHY